MATLAQNIQRAINDFNTIENAIVQKGVPVPEGTPTSEYGEKILSIETGVDTSGDTVVPSALREGYTAHNAAGQEITGTIPNYHGGNTVEMTSPDGATLNTAGTYCESDIEVIPNLQEKVATAGEIVTADEGYSGLKSVDTTPVYEAGKKSEYDAFWDLYQENGNRKDYNYAFTRNWGFSGFTPKYSMKPTKANCMFYAFGEGGNRTIDFIKLLNDAGVTVDFSQCILLSNLFGYSLCSTIPTIDTRSCSNLFYMLRDSYLTKTIEKIILKEDGSQLYDNTFIGCQSLQNVIIEGTIGGENFNVSYSPLSKASLVSIVNALSSTTTGLTVALRLAAVNTAFETTAGAADGSTSDEWTALIATKPNWTINLINS